jgi:hypothetical protein
LFVPDGDEVVVEDNECQEVQEEVGALAVDVIVGLAVALQYLAANGRQQGHADENDEEKNYLKIAKKLFCKKLRCAQLTSSNHDKFC